MSSDLSPPIETHAPAIAAAQVRGFLSDRVGPGVSDLTPLRQGGWSSAWSYRHAGQAWVIRFNQHLEDFEKDRRAAGWSSPALPVPAIVAIGEALDGHYAISERVAGIPLDDLDGDQYRALLPSLFALLDALHEIDPGGRGYGGWDADGNAPFLTWAAYLKEVANDPPAPRGHGWRARLETSPVGADRFDEAFAVMAALAEAMPTDRHVIHSDLLNYNVLVSGVEDATVPGRHGVNPYETGPSTDRSGIRADGETSLALSGVLDWGCGLVGDPVYDLAWFAWYWPWYPAWADIDIVAEARRHYDRFGLDVPDLDRRLRCYALHIGLGDQRYNAYMGRWGLVETAAVRTLALARADGAVFRAPPR